MGAFSIFFHGFVPCLHGLQTSTLSVQHLHRIARSFCELTRVLYGWLQDELCRTRKSKPLVGLAVVVDMINAQGIFPGFSVHFRETL